jgi:type I restriction enzyme S subunit
VCIPPLPEQKKIAEILSGIDTAIEISCAHLSKVIESRKVVTGDLLANGIGHTSFCDSEIGRIPTKWELITGNDALELGGGASPSAIQFRHNGDTLYMKVDDFNNPQNAEYIKMTKLSYDTIDNPSAKPYAKDTIVIAKRGAAIEKNRVRIFETETYVDTNLMTIRSTHYLPRFLAAYLRHLNLSNLADMTSIPQINNFHLQKLRLPMPAMSEQAEICMSIDSLSFLEEKYRAKVQKLELLKSSLSSDLLSGRKRVSI